MGREIRRVPSNWEHPQDDKGHYIPLYDEGRKGALRRWFQEFEQPVFSSLDELQDWLVGQGFSRKAAAGFAKDGWVPSMISDGKKVYMGIEVYDMVD